jgi:MSHA type pilus biogenesis protein MshL
MKSIQQIFQYSSLLMLLLVFSSCSSQPPQKVEEATLPPAGSTEALAKKATTSDPASLPVEYQKPSYTIGSEKSKDDKELAKSDVAYKVGATIRTTTGPQPLRDILKRLAVLKGLNVSWASDVDQNALVDVDINANDDFHEAIDHLLRQVNYFHDTKESTLIIKNKETRQFHIAMPFIAQTYTTDTGGDVLGNDEKASTFKGKINVTATGSPVGSSAFDANKDAKNNTRTQFDIWANIEGNLKVILDILETSETRVSSSDREFGGTGQYSGTGNRSDSNSGSSASGAAKVVRNESASAADERKSVKTSRQTSKTGAFFTIDKPVGIITVTATRDLLERVDEYLTLLKKELYKQVNIEAKIIEIELIKNSDIGINWSKVLKNFSVTGITEFGIPNVITNADGTISKTGSGQVWPNPGANTFISTVSLNNASFTVFLNALKEEGNTKVLSSPKISVMNGEPAFITVGTNDSYIDKVTSTTESTTGTVTYTVSTSRILSGVGLALTANIMDNKEVIMNLVPVTSNLQKPIVYKDFGINASGTAAASVGLPVVDIREMSTTVRVKNGEMLIIGGLINNRDKKDGQFAPILGDIPIVKYLFGYDSDALLKRELIILLKPTII